MENYFENYKKYNKVLFKYMNYKKNEVDYSLFTPHHSISGYEILRWIMYKIIHNAKENKEIRFINLIKKTEAKVIIQEWYDINSPKGYINIVQWIEKFTCNNKKNIDREKMISISHIAFYNACVDYILKTS